MCEVIVGERPFEVVFKIMLSFNDMRFLGGAVEIFDAIFGSQRYLPIKNVNWLTPVRPSCVKLSEVKGLLRWFSKLCLV